MPDDDDDLADRIARLQRLAYGAETTDAERDAAEAELAALRNPDRAEGAPAVRSEPRSPADEAVASSAPVAGAADPRPHPAPAADPPASPLRGLRAALPLSAATLVIGAVAGWALGTGIEPSEGFDVGVPIEQTAAWEVFDRPATDGDFVRQPGPLVDIGTDDATQRLLLVRSDGVHLLAARTTDGENACLILALPVGHPATACTEDGRFPRDGLRAEISVQGVGVYVAGWRPDGTVEVNTAAAPTG